MDNDSVRAACAAGGEEGGNVPPADGPTKKPSVWRAGVKRGWPLQLLVRGGDCRRKAQRTEHWRFNPRSS